MGRKTSPHPVHIAKINTTVPSHKSRFIHTPSKGSGLHGLAIVAGMAAGGEMGVRYFVNCRSSFAVRGSASTAPTRGGSCGGARLPAELVFPTQQAFSHSDRKNGASR